MRHALASLFLRQISPALHAKKNPLKAWIENDVSSVEEDSQTAKPNIKV
jgi:hypothetical protein